MAGLRRAVRQRHVWLLAPFVALVTPLSRPISDNSFLWHVRAGTEQLDAGEVLRADPFSYTSGGEAWRTQSWLAELGYGWLERVFDGVGWSVLLVLVALLTSGLLVVLRGSRLGASLPALVGVGLLFVFQAFSFAVPRPVVLTYPLLAAVTLLVDDDEGELWLAPALVWLWASLHGSFVLGLGVLGLDAIRRRSPVRAAVTAGAGLAASLSAHGFAVWGILIDFMQSRETLGFIEEWARPSPTDLRAAPFFLVIALLLVLAVMRRFDVADLVMVVPFALFGFAAVRNLLPALIVVAPVVAARLLPAGTTAGTRRRPSELPVVNAALMAALLVLLVVVAVSPHRFDRERFPSDDVVAALAEGRVFHDDAVGGYLIWSVGPDRQVFIDDRAELYGAAGFTTLGAAMRGDGVLRLFADLGVEQALVAVDAPVVEVLREAGWAERAGDRSFVLLVPGG